MEGTIATASKDILAIKKREVLHKGYRGIQILLGGRTENVRSLLLYPYLNSPKVFADLCNRMGCYFPEGSYDDLEINVIGDEATLMDDSESAPAEQAKFETDHLQFSFHDQSEVDQLVNGADRILVWDKAERFDRLTLPRIRKLEVVDPEYYSVVEATTWERVSSRVRRSVDTQSRNNFRELEQISEDCSSSYVFATGPSLDDVFDFEIPEDALSIACNSMVRNDELLEHIQPDVIVFADPVFHFGPSRYAQEFREDAVAALRKYDCKAVVPKEQHSLFAGHFPELSDQIIGIDRVKSSKPIYPNHDRLEVSATGNIMTLFMLPIAASLTDDIRIVGADGRKENESYFWEHSDAAQYDDELMQTVAETHPSFFRDRVYEDYYDKHVKTLTKRIEHAESRGATVSNLTNSYIQCLAERKVSPHEIT